jgi:glycosyltransferase involved in cell wall biosynthesis
MVTVVIPTYNRAGLLPRALDSVFAQTVSDLELIVVDDGSTDGTDALVGRYGDSRLQYLRIDHGGVSRARNEGVSAAGGDWIGFLDSDDFWHPLKLERQLETLEAYPAFSAVYTNEIWIRRGRRVNPRKRHRKYSGWIYDRCLPLCIISPSSILLRRSLLDESGGFDETYPVCEDYELWLRLTARHPVYFLDEPLITKTGGHADQLSRSRWGLDRFRVRALLKIADSGRLSPQQRIWTAREIVAKTRILAEGFANRGKFNAARGYARVAERWRPESAWSRDCFLRRG